MGSSILHCTNSITLKLKIMRKKIIEAIFRIASDEFETIADVKELAMMTDEQLVDNLIGMIDYLKNELDDLNS